MFNVMKKIQMIAGLFAAAALLLSSCGKEETITGGGSGSGADGSVAVTFNMSTPAGDKVVYPKSRALHDESEYAIKTLTMYEYSVESDGTTKFIRTLTSGEESTDTTFKLSDNGNGSYSFTVRYPAADLLSSKKFKYLFVANNTPAAPTAGDAIETYKGTLSTVVLGNGHASSVLAQNGIAMSGKAISVKDKSDVITLQKGLECKVDMKRIVARVDIKYEVPNLLVTKVEAHNVPTKGYLFEDDNNDLSALNTYVDIGLNSNITLPTEYLQDQGKESETIKKALYLYERNNTAEDQSIVIHIEYQMLAGTLLYRGSVDVPFCTKTGTDEAPTTTWVNTERNHLYTIQLGDKDSGSSTLEFKLLVEDWKVVESDEMVTE